MKSETIAELYLRETRGADAVALYRLGLTVDINCGLAFFNALGAPERAILRGSLADPRYGTTSLSIEQAIEYIIDHEDQTIIRSTN